MRDLVIQRQQDSSKRKPYWVQFVHKRIEKKRNFLGVFTGETGSGKSLSTISFADMLDSSFVPNMKQRIVFGMLPLMELLNDTKNPLKTGDVVVWEEGGVGISSRDWQSLSNKLINFLLQTFRHRQIILLVNVPFMDFLDSNTRKLFHAQFDTLKIDYEKKLCYVKPRLLQYNARYKKTYEKMLRVATGFGVAPVRDWGIPKPERWVCETYERMKLEFTGALNEDIVAQLKAQSSGNRKPLTRLQQQAVDLMKELKNSDEVAVKMGTTPRNVRFHLERSRNKGYDVEENAEKGGIKRLK